MNKPLDDQYFSLNLAALTEQQQAEIAVLQALPDTVCVNTDVLLWLKSKDKGYQAQMNAILRAEMLRELERLHH